MIIQVELSKKELKRLGNVKSLDVRMLLEIILGGLLSSIVDSKEIFNEIQKKKN